MILQATEEEAKHGRALKGRQALLIVYRFYNIDEDLGVAYATVDLMNVTWKGDAKIEAFLNDWTMVLGGIKEPPSADLVETLFYRQLKMSTILREDVAHYERAEKGTSHRSYEFLLGQLRKYIERKRHEQNRTGLGKGKEGVASNCYPSCIHARGEQGVQVPRKRALQIWGRMSFLTCGHRYGCHGDTKSQW